MKTFIKIILLSFVFQNVSSQPTKTIEEIECITKGIRRGWDKNKPKILTFGDPTFFIQKTADKIIDLIDAYPTTEQGKKFGTEIYCSLQRMIRRIKTSKNPNLIMIIQTIDETINSLENKIKIAKIQTFSRIVPYLLETTKKQLLDQTISNKENHFEILEKLIEQNKNLNKIADIALQVIMKPKLKINDYRQALIILEKIVEKKQAFNEAKKAIDHLWNNPDRTIKYRLLALINDLVKNEQFLDFAQEKSLEIFNNPKSDPSVLVGALWILQTLVIKNVPQIYGKINSRLVNMINNQKQSFEVKNACLSLISTFVQQNIITRPILSVLKNITTPKTQLNLYRKGLQIISKIVQQGQHLRFAKERAAEAIKINADNVKIDAMRLCKALVAKKEYLDEAKAVADKNINKLLFKDESIKIYSELVKQGKFLDEAEKLYYRKETTMPIETWLAKINLLTSLVMNEMLLDEAVYQLNEISKPFFSNKMLNLNPITLKLNLETAKALTKNPQDHRPAIKNLYAITTEDKNREGHLEFNIYYLPKENQIEWRKLFLKCIDENICKEIFEEYINILHFKPQEPPESIEEQRNKGTIIRLLIDI